MKNGNLAPDFPVIHEKPPNYDEIVAEIPRAAEDGVIFAYHPAVYVPSGRPLSVPLLVHEQTHLRQQEKDPIGWWKRYLVDLDFRFEQELEAHQAEYRAFCELHKDRNSRAIYLGMISRRLASSLYGCGRKPSEVTQMIRRAA